MNDDEYTAEQFKKDIAETFTWFGHDPRYFVTNDGSVLSFEFAHKEQDRLFLSTKNKNDCWQIADHLINYDNGKLRCAVTSKKIPTAFGEH